MFWNQSRFKLASLEIELSEATNTISTLEAKLAAAEAEVSDLHMQLSALAKNLVESDSDRALAYGLILGIRDQLDAILSPDADDDVTRDLDQQIDEDDPILAVEEVDHE